MEKQGVEYSVPRMVSLHEQHAFNCQTLNNMIIPLEIICSRLVGVGLSYSP